jgi:hypothetical protein
LQHAAADHPALHQARRIIGAYLAASGQKLESLPLPERARLLDGLEEQLRMALDPLDKESLKEKRHLIIDDILTAVEEGIMLW